MTNSKTLFFCLAFFLQSAVGEHCKNLEDCNSYKVSATTGDGPKSAKLLLVQTLFRHGDRAPVMGYKNNPNNPSIWKHGLGQLTMLGRKQHYAVGKYLHDRYKDFATFSPVEIEAVSTDLDRTMASAQSHLAGFFSPPKEWKIDDGLNWQPIPIHTKPRAEDRALYVFATCPKAEREYESIFRSPEGQKFVKEHEETIKKLSEFSGEDLDLLKAITLYDTIRIERKYGHEVPEWFEPFWTEMDEMADKFQTWWGKSPVLKRLRTGPLIKLIIDNMLKKIGGESPDLKFYLYSAHDSAVAIAFTALDVFNNKQPPYACVVVFELHGMTDGTHAMRLLFLNSTAPEKQVESPHVFIIPGCTEYCPINYIKEYVQDISIDEAQFKKECSSEETWQ